MFVENSRKCQQVEPQGSLQVYQLIICENSRKCQQVEPQGFFASLPINYMWKL